MEVVETVEQAELITWDEAGALAEETMRAWRYDTLIPNYASEKHGGMQSARRYYP